MNLSEPRQLLYLASVVVLLTPLIRYFRSLRTDWPRWMLTRLIAGLVIGSLTSIDLAGAPPGTIVTAVVLAVALVVCSDRLDVDSVDVLLSVSLMISAAALPLLAFRDAVLETILRTAIATAIAMLCVHFAFRFKPLLRLLMIAGGAVAIYRIAILDLDFTQRASLSLILILGAGPLFAIVSVLALWRTTQRELQDETSLGFFDRDEIAQTSHPFFRMRFARWHDRDARRKFVQLATDLALRKSRQRRMKPDLARLYQLEIIKIRMELAEMVRIERQLRSEALSAGRAEDGSWETGDGRAGERRELGDGR